MTHQMARGSQVAFAKAWLERRGIESQTIDVHSHIDSSLSYEENIKSLKQMLGMGGRSTKKATRNLSAAECDVAVGNYEAGFDHESTREACECGEPKACDDMKREKGATAKTKAAPLFPPNKPKKKDYKPAKTWGEFVKINKTQINKHTAGIKKWAAGEKDKKQGEKLFKREIRQYNIDLTDIWSKTKEKAAEPTTTPKKKNRLEIQRELLASSKTPISTILKEVQELKPMGRRSEIGMIMGVMPRKGVPVNTAVGEIVFAKNRQPTREQLKRWEGLQKESEKRSNEAIRLSFGAVGEGGTIGNKLAQKHGEELLKEGLLTPEEATYVKKARKFWKEHPHADTGVVRGGKILELNIKTGEVAKAKPKAAPSTAKKAPTKPTPTPAQIMTHGYGYKPAPPIAPPAPLAAAAPKPPVMLGLGSAQEVTKSKRKTAAKKPAKKKTAAKTTKPKPKAAPKRRAAKPKPKAAPKAKKTAASTAYKLTAAQKKRLAANGRVTIKRGGKFITITK